MSKARGKGSVKKMSEEKGFRDYQAEATRAALDEVATALREPEPGDIPRDERGSFVERLGSVVAMVRQLRGRAVCDKDWCAINTLEMVADKIDAIASDMALADEKGEGDAETL